MENRYEGHDWKKERGSSWCCQLTVSIDGVEWSMECGESIAILGCVSQGQSIPCHWQGEWVEGPRKNQGRRSTDRVGER